ncbi:Orn/Lys/Arg family decarboxylase [Arthrobacter cheniae]|uniref:Orn/Lys/Arg family decarboxylase n=1 Tax=Arthrobacter cheniae TaxID=1258888 RepID=UPI001C7D923D|nr:hypothetical protein [Arthrobacter cheniae]
MDPIRLAHCADFLATTSASTLIYAAMDGWRRQMVQDGHDMIDRALALTRRVREQIEELPGLHVLEEELTSHEASKDLDIMHILVDVSGLRITGYQAHDWLRENCRLDFGTTDHRRFEITMSIADDESTVQRLMDGLRLLIDAAPDFPESPPILIPDEGELDLETVMLPRDAFFGPVEDISVEDSVGRIVAELATPYPPGVPVFLPGERINEAAVRYLRSGVEAGMVLPDPGDASLKTIRVVKE